MLLFICTMVSVFVHHDRSNFLGFVAMAGFWTSGVLLFLYVVNVVTFLTVVPWVKVVSVVTFLTVVPWVKVVSVVTVMC